MKQTKQNKTTMKTSKQTKNSEMQPEKNLSLAHAKNQIDGMAVISIIENSE